MYQHSLTIPPSLLLLRYYGFLRLQHWPFLHQTSSTETSKDDTPLAKSTLPNTKSMDGLESFPPKAICISSLPQTPTTSRRMAQPTSSHSTTAFSYQSGYQRNLHSTRLSRRTYMDKMEASPTLKTPTPTRHKNWCNTAWHSSCLQSLLNQPATSEEPKQAIPCNNPQPPPPHRTPAPSNPTSNNSPHMSNGS